MDPTPGTPRYAADARLRARLADNLAAFTPIDGDPAHRRPASVAITVVDDGDGVARLVLTRRAARLRAHAGQWAIPGGRVDEGEDTIETALRELHEEVGLGLGPDCVLGALDPYPTRSGYEITPVVLWAGRVQRWLPNPAEVASIHLIPVGELDRDDAPRFVSIEESDRPVVQMPIDGDLIHAPTAAVLYPFRVGAVHGRATRVAHLEQPVWAWG
ncbi:MAG: NUDIX hydrolase [Acidimicrobiales bacterium]